MWSYRTSKILLTYKGTPSDVVIIYINKYFILFIDQPINYVVNKELYNTPRKEHSEVLFDILHWSV